ATLLVGLHEGFGLPPLESMGYGTIPIVSNTSSLPEVVGEAGFQVDPYSPQEIAQAMLDAQLLTPRRRALYRRKGKEQFSLFNWNRSAEKVWQLMKEVAQQHHD
ncbi:glycosyltransferase, partial [Candidatus Woesebacteria bacterium]|nr:glycosyltransferase [Candidatus Woesebacteria bacterium]